MATKTNPRSCSLAAWRVLMAPIRSEVAEALRLLGTASIAEVARMIDRPADSLYRHVAALQKHQLVDEVGFRKTGRHAERLFRLAAEDFKPDFTHESTARINRAIHDTASTLLKATTRAVRDAAAAEALQIGAAQNVALSYELGWLTPEAFLEVRMLVSRLKVLMDHSKLTQEGALYLTLAVICPVSRKRAAALDVRAEAPRPKESSLRSPRK